MKILQKNYQKKDILLYYHQVVDMLWLSVHSALKKEVD